MAAQSIYIRVHCFKGHNHEDASTYRIPALISGLLAIKTYPRPLSSQITKGVPTDHVAKDKGNTFIKTNNFQ